MGLFTNRVEREELRPGNHIYTWRDGRFYAHHGIYIGDDKVIHFTSQGKSDRFSCPISSSSSSSVRNGNGVVCSSLDNFLKGDKLYRYKYSVSTEWFFSRVVGGTCTVADSDDADVVIHRATYLLHNGFGSYHLSNNNCENFAVYCKTGLVVWQQRTAGQSGQILSIATGYSKLIARYKLDIGVRRDVTKFPVEEIANFLP